VARKYAREMFCFLASTRFISEPPEVPFARASTVAIRAGRVDAKNTHSRIGIGVRLKQLVCLISQQIAVEVKT
ncbi:MAG: hypothetical protein DMF15_03130, partial [Verrucomicrobia bacterium]